MNVLSKHAVAEDEEDDDEFDDPRRKQNILKHHRSGWETSSKEAPDETSQTE